MLKSCKSHTQMRLVSPYLSPDSRVLSETGGQCRLHLFGQPTRIVLDSSRAADGKRLLRLRPAVLSGKGISHPTALSSWLATRPNEGFEDHLQQLMETEKPYLNPNLTIMELARMMNTNVPTLRNVSKQKYGSFIKMVNFYRLSHAKELHKEHPEYSKQAIAEDSGFGSYRSLLRAEKAENE